VNIQVKFLWDSSDNTLGEYELARLNHAANLKKELRALIEQLVEATAEADFVRWLLENKEELRSTISSLDSGQERFDFGQETKTELAPKTRATRALWSNAAD